MKTRSPVLSAHRWRHWLLALLVAGMPLQNAAARCAAAHGVPAAPGAPVVAAVMTVDATAADELVHRCCAHEGSRSTGESCNLHCLAAAVAIHSLPSMAWTPTRTSATPLVPTFAFSAQPAPVLRPPISS